MWRSLRELVIISGVIAGALLAILYLASSPFLLFFLLRALLCQ